MNTLLTTTASNYYPRLKEHFDRLTEDQRTAFKVWIQLPKGLGCSYGKAYQISKGLFTGTTLERREIASYLNQSEEILFDQTSTNG